MGARSEDLAPISLPRDRRDVAIQSEVYRLKSSIRASQEVPVTIRRSEHRDVGLVIAIVVAGHRNVTVESEPDSLEASVRAEGRIPDTCRRTIDSQIRLAVTIEVSTNRNVAVETEVSCHELSIRASQPVPVSVARAEDRDVIAAVTVHVGGKRLVFRQPEAGDREACTVALLDVPDTGRRTEHSEVVDTVAIVVAACRDVRRESELFRRDTGIRAAFDVPDTKLTGRSKHRGVGSTITVVVRRDDLVVSGSELAGGKARVVLRVPDTGGRSVDREVITAVTIEVGVVGPGSKDTGDLAGWVTGRSYNGRPKSRTKLAYLCRGNVDRYRAKAAIGAADRSEVMDRRTVADRRLDTCAGLVASEVMEFTEDRRLCFRRIEYDLELSVRCCRYCSSCQLGFERTSQ